MSLFELSCWCHHFYLNYVDFLALRGLSPSEVRDYTLERKKISALDFEKAFELLEKLRSPIEERQVLYPGHVCYPANLLKLDQPPVFLMYEGDVSLLQNEMIAVVGTRKPDENFLFWLDTELKSFLEKTNAAVVSGGALGIDQKSSQIALRCNKPTIIVLPSGLSVPYPATIKKQFCNSNVLFLSEYFPQQGMQKSHFVRRNRLISGLGKILFAVQFEIKSGTMITVNYGLAQNKEIVTLPDHPLHFLSSGNLKIMKEGAHIITTGEELSSLWESVY